MITFAIALKSKEVSKNWDYTCSLLERTLNSIYNQTNKEIAVVIVCHEKPLLSSSYPDIVYHQVDFAPPEKSYHKMILDRDIKEVLGRKVAKSLNSDYIMAIDSDDCISNQISEFIAQKSLESSNDADGFFADRGYMFYEESGKIVPKSGLYHCCGSTVALKTELYDTPDSWEYDDLVEFKNNGRFFSHGDLATYWQSKGKRLSEFPFRSCIYVRPSFEPSLDATRNSISSSIAKRDIKLLLSPLKRKVSKFFSSQDVTQDVRDEFGFYIIERNYEREYLMQTQSFVDCNYRSP